MIANETPIIKQMTNLQLKVTIRPFTISKTYTTIFTSVIGFIQYS